MNPTPLALESHRKSQQFHAAIARRASLVPQREDRSYSIPNTPFGVAKIKMLPRKAPVRNHEPDWWPTMWFFDLVFVVPRRAATNAPRVEDVMRAVREEFKVGRNDMLSRRKNPHIAIPRMVAYYLSRSLTKRTLPEIGRLFGRDHTSILAGIRRIEAMRQTDKTLDARIQTVAASLGGTTP